ncbi:alpha/beta fold hydrolase [Rhodotorula paludigena]|uniref:alpha/beta fold hydrolase n=1 Tax=Rhodotorula paludigena TaxID=86838 RepID=UPI003179C47F
MPYTSIPEHKLDLFWVLNPDAEKFASASREDGDLPSSQPLKPELPVLVLIHPAGGRVQGWANQLGDPRFSQHYNLLAIDCPMHGLSRSTERDKHTLEDSADCVLRVLDELDLQQYSLWGEGPHGVNIAAWIAVKRDEKVQSLILATPGWRKEEPSVKASLIELEEGMFVNKNGQGTGDGSFPRDLLEEILIYCVGSDQRMASARQEMGDYFEGRYGAGKPAYEFRFLFTFVYNREPIPQAKLDKVTCPVLLLRGGADPVVCPPSAVEEWQRAFPNARGGASIHTISPAPNIISMCEGNIVNRIASRFLSEALA